MRVVLSASGGKHFRVFRTGLLVLLLCAASACHAQSEEDYDLPKTPAEQGAYAGALLHIMNRQCGFSDEQMADLDALMKDIFKHSAREEHITYRIMSRKYDAEYDREMQKLLALPVEQDKLEPVSEDSCEAQLEAIARWKQQ